MKKCVVPQKTKSRSQHDPEITHTHTHAYVYTIEYYLALKKKELLIHALTRMSLEDVMLGE